MNLDSAVQTFLAESRELLDTMEEQLLQLETNPDGGADIDAIFRAAHTIKGSAGLFGFDDVVRFTHRVENLLDRLRGKQLGLDADCVALLLACCDFIRALVEAIATGAPLTPEAKQTWDTLVSRLDIHLGGRRLRSRLLRAQPQRPRCSPPETSPSRIPPIMPGISRCVSDGMCSGTGWIRSHFSGTWARWAMCYISP
ncbi:MAG: Hpt domain-containing protein [Nitrospira sp.]|nr:Hpt domain-containing protein [Nitrospira sp.]